MDGRACRYVSVLLTNDISLSSVVLVTSCGRAVRFESRWEAGVVFLFYVSGWFLV